MTDAEIQECEELVRRLQDAIAESKMIEERMASLTKEIEEALYGEDGKKEKQDDSNKV